MLTLNARARESLRPDAMLKDEKAVEMVNRIDYDFSQFRMPQHDEIAIIMRVRKFDNHVRDFLRRNPRAVVVNIGCGLDTRFERVDNGLVEWFDLDMPNVIDLRNSLINTESLRNRSLSTSVLEDDWIHTVTQFKPLPFMFIAEGVLPYFEETHVRALFLKLRDHFPGCELVCDAHTPFVVRVDNLLLIFSKIKARLKWSIRQGSDPENWGNGIHLLDEWNYYEDDEPRLKAFRWARNIPAIAKSSGVFHYRLGQAP